MGRGGAGSSMGLAGASAFGSHIGLVAIASVGSNQKIEVHKLFAAVDCGRVVNRGIVLQQIEAGLIWAMAQATVTTPEFIAGAPAHGLWAGFGTLSGSVIASPSRWPGNPPPSQYS